MKRTMKIDEDVAVRLASFKKKYKSANYSDLLESFCDFFEITRLEPTDFDNSRKPPSVVITERTNRIISFIKKGEDKYLKEILNYVEKIYLTTHQNNTFIADEIKDETPKKSVSATPKEPHNLEEIIKERTKSLQLENAKIRSENEDVMYKMNHQKKMIKEFMTKVTPGKFGAYQIPKEVFVHYKEEFDKL